MSSTPEQLTTPKPCVLRRSYTVIPGQSFEQHEEMSARRDLERLAWKEGGAAQDKTGCEPAFNPNELPLGLANVGRSVAEASQNSQEPAKKKRKAPMKRKKKLTATSKRMANDEMYYEITLADGSVVLTKPLAFA